jgi:hypothetical protein
MTFFFLFPVAVAASFILICTCSKNVDYKAEAKHQGRAGWKTNNKQRSKAKKARKGPINANKAHDEVKCASHS